MDSGEEETVNPYLLVLVEPTFARGLGEPIPS
jgi:hypothetical protein